MKQGSSPHTRGALGFGAQLRDRFGIIPAYAGSTAPGRCFWRCSRDHPRIRGEHLARNAELLFGEGSSPHTRGAPGNYLQYGNEPRIIPAYAGSTRKTTTSGSTTTDHPRIRGEHEGAGERAVVYAGSSPHTRGALPGDQAGGFEARIIPAYAGSTARVVEHLHEEGGSSPHTRGARTTSRTPPMAWRIIPAYAGSTPQA